jgi:hypothetical protein
MIRLPADTYNPYANERGAARELVYIRPRIKMGPATGAGSAITVNDGASTLEQARAPLPRSLEQIIRQRMREQNELWRGLNEMANAPELTPLEVARLHIQASEAAGWYRALHEMLVEAGLEPAPEPQEDTAR